MLGETKNESIEIEFDRSVSEDCAVVVVVVDKWKRKKKGRFTRNSIENENDSGGIYVTSFFFFSFFFMKNSMRFAYTQNIRVRYIMSSGLSLYTHNIHRDYNIRIIISSLVHINKFSSRP